MLILSLEIIFLLYALISEKQAGIVEFLDLILVI